MGIATTFVANKRLTAAQLNLKPYLHAYQTVTQTLTTSVWAEITMDAEAVDTLSGHSVVTNTARYTPTVAGWYRCTGQVGFAVNGTGSRLAQFRKNGAQVDTAPYGPSVAQAVNGGAWAHGTISCNGTSDYISLWGWQSSGAGLATAYVAGNVMSTMMIEWVAPL